MLFFPIEFTAAMEAAWDILAKSPVLPFLTIGDT
jgi:hypothetical protein